MGLFSFFKKEKEEPKITEKTLYAINPYQLVFMLSQIGKIWGNPSVTKTMYNQYEEYDFNERNYKKLIKDGWIRASDSKEALSNLKLTELREIAKKFDVAVKGKKDEIIAELTAALTDEQLDSLQLPSVTVATDLGIKIIEANPHIVYFAKNRNVFKCDFDAVQKAWRRIHAFEDSFPEKLEALLEPELFDFYDLLFDENCITHYETEAERKSIIRDIRRDWARNAKDDYKDALKKIKADFKK